MDSPLILYQGKKPEIAQEIIRIIEFFLMATGRELETFQIQILAGDLYDKFKSDTLEDIVLMFKMARQGDFGKIYKVDVFEVMNWANAYLERKSQERERMLKSIKKEVENKEPKGKYFHELPQEMQEKFNQLGGVAKSFLPLKASEELEREKLRRSLENEDKKKKKIKFKKYI